MVCRFLFGLFVARPQILSCVIEDRTGLDPDTGGATRERPSLARLGGSGRTETMPRETLHPGGSRRWSSVAGDKPVSGLW